MLIINSDKNLIKKMFGILAENCDTIFINKDI